MITDKPLLVNLKIQILSKQKLMGDEREREASTPHNCFIFSIKILELEGKRGHQTKTETINKEQIQ